MQENAKAGHRNKSRCPKNRGLVKTDTSTSRLSFKDINPSHAGTFLPREGSPRAYKAQGLARLIPKLTRKVAGKRPTLISDLQVCWPDIVGSDIAQVTRPTKLRGHILHLDIAMGAGLTLAMQQDSMLTRINTYLGSGKVRRLALSQTDRPLPCANLSTEKRLKVPQDTVRTQKGALTDTTTGTNEQTSVGLALQNLKQKLEARSRPVKKD